jgi:hypothetical protein
VLGKGFPRLADTRRKLTDVLFVVYLSSDDEMEGTAYWIFTSYLQVKDYHHARQVKNHAGLELVNGEAVIPCLLCCHQTQFLNPTHRIVCYVDCYICCREKTYVWNRWNNCEFFQQLLGLSPSLLRPRYVSAYIHTAHWLTYFWPGLIAQNTYFSYLFITYRRSSQIFQTFRRQKGDVKRFQYWVPSVRCQPPKVSRTGDLAHGVFVQF